MPDGEPEFGTSAPAGDARPRPRVCALTPGRRSAPGGAVRAAPAVRRCVPVPNFALILVHGASWDSSRPIREQRQWDEHAAFMDGLVEDGFILLGGPLGDGHRTLHVVQAADEDAVRRRVAQDPWARAGMLEVGSIERWALWLDFRTLQAPPR